MSVFPNASSVGRRLVEVKNMRENRFCEAEGRGEAE
jgi:hypothetical protein